MMFIVYSIFPECTSIIYDTRLLGEKKCKRKRILDIGRIEERQECTIGRNGSQWYCYKSDIIGTSSEDSCIKFVFDENTTLVEHGLLYMVYSSSIP